MRYVIATALLAIAPVAAQGFAVYVPNSDPTTGAACNVIPFGTVSSSSTWVNQRYQTVATAGELNNTPGLVTGLRFAPCQSGIHESTTIQITMAHVPNGFDLSVNTDFNNNLNTLGSNATVVLDQNNYSWEMTASVWSSIGFDFVFPYNGSDDLLIDVLVTGNNAVGAGNSSMRRETQPRLYAFGWTGTPPATGTFGASALKMGVEFGCSGLSEYGSGCAGVAMDLSGSATIGNSFTADMTGGDAGTPAVFNVGGINTSPYPIDLTPFGFRGCNLYTDSAVSVGGSTDAAGNFSVSLNAPNVPALVGVQVYAQCLTIKPSAPAGGAASNAGRILFGSDC